LYDQPTGRLALVFELMDANLYELIKGRRHYLNPQLIKGYMWQLMKSLDHMHRKGIFHRDIKPENILIENSNDVSKGLKLADLGSCRGIYSKQPYTEYISTRWYRAPECLLTDGYYGPEMDLWGAGCVFFEITSLYPLFPGSNEVDQINRIHKVLGSPSAEVLTKFRSKGSSHISLEFPEAKGMGIPQLIPHAPADCIDLIVKLLKYDASERISARETMRHPFFKECRETEARLAQSQKASTGAPVLTETSRSAQPVKTGSSKTVPAAATEPVAQGKALPSISGENVNANTNYSKNVSIKSGNAAGSQQQGGAVHQGVQPSTLPPIGGGAAIQGNNATGGKYFLPVQQKKKKKDSRLRRNNGGNTEQVLRAYGHPQGGGAPVDQDLGITSGNSISYGTNKISKR
jgi:renal tumor antigen